jgi:hypothetical protein
MGTVIKVSDETVTVETNTKTTVEVMIASDTKFSKNGAPASPSDLHIGDRVVIHAMPMKDGKLMAHAVRLVLRRHQCSPIDRVTVGRSNERNGQS